MTGQDSFTPKNILVTGGAGFIASHVVMLLVKKYPQYKIVNLDKLDYCSSLLNLEEINDAPNYKFIKGNIRSGEFINYLFKTEEIDTILHFAAQTHVDNSFGNSFKFTQDNVFGTHTLLEAAKVHGIKRFIHVSTDEVYGESAATDDVVEDTILEPTNPYAATKAAAEFLVKAYYKSFKLPVIITRGNNVYGPHQYPEKLIPKFCLLLQRDKPLWVHGRGTSVRNFLYVEDTARAFDCILHKGSVGQVYNVGTDFETSVLGVAEDLLRIVGKADQKDKYLNFVEDRPFNDCRYAIDSSKLRSLGWEPQVSWEQGLQRTYEWYQKNAGNWANIEGALAAHPRAAFSCDDI